MKRGFFGSFSAAMLSFLGAGGEAVAAPPCPYGDCRRADWDQDCERDVNDLFAFLAGYFSGSGDYNCDGGAAVQDIFDYLEDYFRNCAPCPDLDVAGVDLPDFLVPGCPFTANLKIGNPGFCRVPTSASVLARLSLNGVWGDFDDLVVANTSIPTSGLAPTGPGGERSYALACLMPDNVILGNYLERIDVDRENVVNECDGGNNVYVDPVRIQVACNDLRVAVVSAPATCWTPGQSIPVTVTVENLGPCQVQTNLHLECLGNAANYPIAVGGGDSVTFVRNLAAPTTPGNCGCFSATLLARADAVNGCDRNAADNTRTTAVSLQKLYWDARLEINGPSSFCICQPNRPLNFTVTVTNHGNIVCPGVTVCAGLVDDDGPTPGTCAVTGPGVVACLNTVQIAANGGNTTLTFSFPFTCGFFCEPQRLKAWITGGDSCSAGNCDSEVIDIRCCN